MTTTSALDPAISRKELDNILTGRLFLGRFIERRYVDSLRDYVDVILISEAEDQLIKDLHQLAASSCYWLGVVPAETINENFRGICIYSKLLRVSFNAFWFQFYSVTYVRDVALFNIGIRKIINDNYIEQEPILYMGDKEFSKIGYVLNTIKFICTPYNVWYIMQHVICLILLLFALSYELIKFLPGFVLKCLRALNNIIKDSTPAVILFIRVIDKFIGFIYCSVMMLFKDN